MTTTKTAEQHTPSTVQESLSTLPPRSNRRGKFDEKKKKTKEIFRYGELNPGLAGLMLCLRAADASHYTITDYMW
jgi:hypothetical protein